MEMKKFNYMFEFDILRNSSQTFLGVSAFEEFGCPKQNSDALLAKLKTMQCDIKKTLSLRARLSHDFGFLIIF